MAYIIIAIVFGTICSLVAKSKNRNWGLAFLWGFLFGLIALIVYLCLSPLAFCPHCKTGIKTNATICWRCGKTI